MLKGRTVIGVAAGRFHTVLWTREAVYTMGLNGGQLGKSSSLKSAKILPQNKKKIKKNTFQIHDMI